MPNYYAHLVFGRMVFDRLPPVLRGQLNAERDAFHAGLYGPDPLFCYHPMTRNYARRSALEMHKQPVRPVAEGLKAAVEEDLPFARGYAAGFLCHFALDSRCHLYIEEQVERLGLSHAGMEVELDRALMLADGLDPLKETPMPALRLTEDFYKTATAAAYPGVRPDQFKKGLRLYRRLSRLQTKAAGTGIHRVTNWAGNKVTRFSKVRGTVLSPDPDPIYARATRDLLEILNGEVDATAQAVTRFFTAVARNGRLDSWYDRPFGGHKRLETIHLAASR